MADRREDKAATISININTCGYEERHEGSGRRKHNHYIGWNLVEHIILLPELSVLRPPAHAADDRGLATELSLPHLCQWVQPIPSLEETRRGVSRMRQTDDFQCAIPFVW